MPLTTLEPKPVKLQKPLVISYDTWKKGWNILLRETEIDPQEMVTATNLLLVGSGIPTKRWGSILGFQAGASNASLSGVTRFVFPVKDPNDNQQVLAWTDAGYLTKQSGMSYTQLSGASWPSGYNLEAAELGGKVYIVNGQKPLVRYDFTNLLSFISLIPPATLTGTNWSGVSGTTNWAWAVTAVSPVGETDPSPIVSLSNLPYDLSQTSIKLTWSAVSPAAGATLVGYNIYRYFPTSGAAAGESVFIAGVSASTTQYFDTAGIVFNPQAAPTANDSGGPTAKWIMRYQDRLVLAGVPGFPTRVLISGEYPNHERFDAGVIGGFIEIEPDSGEDITGLGTYYRITSATQTIVVFKEKSVWEVAIDVTTVGTDGTTVLNPSYRLLTASQGCTSHRSITPVENDVFFVNQRGIYILRYEPNLYGIINANELSAKIRPFFQSLSYQDISNAAGFYADKKYILAFPYSQQAVCFDRERLSFTGPWTFPWAINMWRSWINQSSGVEHWLAASGTDNNVYEFSANYSSDNGNAIHTQFKSKKEDFGDWTLFKTIQEVFLNFRNITGSINVNLYIEDRSGTVVSAKSATVQGNAAYGTSGMGSDQMGTFEMGTSNSSPNSTPVGETQRKALLYFVGRTLQIEVISSGLTDDYELLNAKSVAISQARDNNPQSWVF